MSTDKYVYNPRLAIPAKKVIRTVTVTLLSRNNFNRSFNAGGGTVGIFGNKIIIPTIAIIPMTTNVHIVIFQSYNSDMYKPTGTPNTVPILIPPTVSPKALPLFSGGTNCVDAATANGENRPAPIPATALDINKSKNVGAIAVKPLAIVKINIEYNRTFLIFLPANIDEKTGAETA